MSESNENKKCCDCKDCTCNCNGCNRDCGSGAAFLILRLWLGVRALLAGIEKFSYYESRAIPVIDPATGQADASGVMQHVNVKHYAFDHYSGVGPLIEKFKYEPLVPKFAVSLFDHVLGPLFILTGVMLLIGLGTRLSLFVQGLIYTALTVGLVLIKQEEGVSWLAIHIALVAFALTLAKHNKFALCKKC
jgi:thiosulfate dehydrogenase [quinone] large subunit